MPIDAGTSLIIILLVAATTFATRFIPFAVFPPGKPIPKTVQYLGQVLTPAIIGMLVVYCLKDTQVMAYPYGIPAFAAVIATAGLHYWKRNMFLSIGAGTAIYMILIRLM